MFTVLRLRKLEGKGGGERGECWMGSSAVSRGGWGSALLVLVVVVELVVVVLAIVLVGEGASRVGGGGCIVRSGRWWCR